MFLRYTFFLAFITCIFVACNPRSKKQISTQVDVCTKVVIDRPNLTEVTFNEFIERFSKDSVFQISRTQLPLKVTSYQIDTDRDSVFYKDRQHLELLDFRKARYDGQYDRWEQKRVVDKDEKNAQIEITGIDNGINVTYLFKKIEGVWMLTEIHDSSTYPRNINGIYWN